MFEHQSNSFVGLFFADTDLRTFHTAGKFNQENTQLYCNNPANYKNNNQNGQPPSEFCGCHR